MKLAVCVCVCVWPFPMACRLSTAAELINLLPWWRLSFFLSFLLFFFFSSLHSSRPLHPSWARGAAPLFLEPATSRASFPTFCPSGA